MEKKYLNLEIEIAGKYKKKIIDGKTIKRFLEYNDRLNPHNTQVLIDFARNSKYLTFENMQQEKKGDKETLWTAQQQKAIEANKTKLASLKSNIDTIERQDLHTQIEEFLLSQQLLLPIISEGGGMGKTTAIAQWVGKQHLHEDYIILFLQGQDYFKHYFEYITHFQPTNKQKFVIILDALDEITYNDTETKNIAAFFENLMKYFQTTFENQYWLKIIFTSRYISWEKYEKHFKDIQQVIAKKIMVGKLRVKEVENVLVKNNIHITIFDFPTAMLDVLKIPLYLRFFIQIFKNNEIFFITNNHLALFELFIQKFIYTGNYIEEKKAIINFILKQNNYGKKSRKINQTEIQKEFNIKSKKENVYPAFQFLLDASIIKSEYVLYNGNLKQNNISVVHSKIFQYFVFKNVLDKAHYLIDTPILADMIIAYKHDETLLRELLQFMLQHLYKENNIKTLQTFYDLPLGNDFMYFWEINYNLAYEYPEIAKKIWQTWAENPNAQIYFFEIFTNFKYLTKGNLAEAWAHYQKHKQNLEAQIFSHAILLKTYLLKNNPALAQYHYEALEKLQPTDKIHPYPIARRWAYMREYEHGAGIASPCPLQKRGFEDLVETDKLAYHTKTNLPAEIKHKQEMEFYLFYESLICQTLNIVGKAEEALKRIEIFIKKYPNFETSPKKIILEAEKIIAEIAIQKINFDNKLLEKIKEYYEQNLLWDIEELYLRLLYLSEDEKHHEVAKEIAKSIGFRFYEKVVITFV